MYGAHNSLNRVVRYIEDDRGRWIILMSVEFTPSDFPFKDRDALLDTYTPEKFVGRDDELEEYQNILQPAIDGSRPKNVFLYGKSGVGKTAATRHLLKKLESAGEQYGVDITTRMINCDASDTSYRVGIELVNSFRDRDNKISERGHARKNLR